MAMGFNTWFQGFSDQVNSRYPSMRLNKDFFKDRFDKGEYVDDPVTCAKKWIADEEKKAERPPIWN